MLYVNVNVRYAYVMTTQQLFGISDLAKEFDVSTRTIRFYEEKGYIHPERKGQQRLYTAADRTRIRLILRGKRIGLTLAESVDIIDMYDPAGSDVAQLESLIKRVAERRNALLQQQRDIEEMLFALDEVHTNCRRALTHAETHAKTHATNSARVAEEDRRSNNLESVS